VQQAMNNTTILYTMIVIVLIQTVNILEIVNSQNKISIIYNSVRIKYGAMIIKALLKSSIVSTTVVDDNRVKTYMRSSPSCLLSEFFDLEANVSARQLLRPHHSCP